MTTFDWITAAVVIVTVVYFILVTLVEWFAALRKGQAVTLLPERKGGRWPLWMQIAILVLGLLLCIPLFYYGWVPLFTPPSSTAQVLPGLGLAIYMAGMSFMLWARHTLGKNWGLSTSLQVKLLDDHQLIQKGPYTYVRHPMYFGWWVAMLGLTLLYPVWALFILFISSLISFIGRARREEVTLAERFGNIWVEYKKQTKFIIPFIY